MLTVNNNKEELDKISSKNLSNNKVIEDKSNKKIREDSNKGILEDSNKSSKEDSKQDLGKKQQDSAIINNK